MPMLLIKIILRNLKSIGKNCESFAFIVPSSKEKSPQVYYNWLFPDVIYFCWFFVGVRRIISVSAFSLASSIALQQVAGSQDQPDSAAGEAEASSFHSRTSDNELERAGDPAGAFWEVAWKDIKFHLVLQPLISRWTFFCCQKYVTHSLTECCDSNFPLTQHKVWHLLLKSTFPKLPR